MRYVEEFRDPARAARLAEQIAAAAGGRSYALMEFCGGHTHALCRHGIADLLPAGVTMIHGPGCPVCVLPVGRLDQAIALARRPGVILATYGDMLRVPGSGGVSLQRVKAEGGDVRMVYSTQAALEIARAHPDRDVVFFAIGFETTTPPTAAAIAAARAENLRNFSVLCNHVLTPAAIHAIMATTDTTQVRIDGFVGPGHVSTVIGAEAYAPVASTYRRPIAIAGFEPIDLMEAILDLLQQINAGTAEVHNLYPRAVRPGGNAKAQALCAEIFALRESFEWRGLGSVPASALRLADGWAEFDAEQRFQLPSHRVPDHKACACADILRGQKKPSDCKVFATACTPETPLGACMVSGEGACAAYYHYGRFREVA